MLFRPRYAFSEAVKPGEQATALIFLSTVVLATGILRVSVGGAEGALVGDRGWLSMVLWIGLLVVLVAPVLLHLLAAIQTVVLVVLAPDRSGVSETVQVIAYATAPCVLAGLDNPVMTILTTGWATALLVYGTAVVHRIGLLRATVAASPVAILGFGYGFGGFAAWNALLKAYYII